MKKKYLTYAGIISAVLLAGMFMGILLTGIPFPFMPAVTTVDPITDMSIDENNMMILTGTTTLAKDSNLFIRVTASPRSLIQDAATGTTKAEGDAWIIPEAHGNNHWRGIVDISSLQPADYTITLATRTYAENFTKRIESDPVATRQFTLGDENAGTGSIRKKTRISTPFIRINLPDQEPPSENTGISGITSLAPGSPLAWSMQMVTSGPDNSSQEFPGNSTVIPGTDGINRWYVVPGTGAMKPGRYQFRITGNPIGNSSPAGIITAMSEFDIPATRQNTTGQISPGFIAIDTLPEMMTEGIYVITGTTSLPPGEELLVEVHPATGFNLLIDRNKGQTGDFSGVAGMITVENGNGGKDLWSFELQTYRLESGKYIVNINNDKFDFATGSVIPGDLSCSRIFTIGG